MSSPDDPAGDDDPQLPSEPAAEPAPEPSPSDEPAPAPPGEEPAPAPPSGEEPAPEYAPPRGSEARWWLDALGVALLVCLTGVFNHSLWAPDEPRVASIGLEMVSSGDWVVPRFGGKPFLEKPPLAWWLMAPGLEVFGASPGAARLAGVLANLLTLLLVFDLTRRLADVRAALIAVVVLATSWGFLWHGHRLVVDGWLAAFMTLGLWCFIRGTLVEGRARAGWVVGVYAAAGLAFLVKGPIGPVLIGGPLVLLLLATRRWDLLQSWGHVIGLAVLLALSALWPLLLYARGGWELLQVFVLDNGLYRVINPTWISPDRLVTGGGHHHGVGFYLGRAPTVLLPWLVLYPAAVVWLKRAALPRGWNREGIAFLAAVFPVGVLLLSLPSTKRTLYLLPLVPCLAPLVGSWVAASGGRTPGDPLRGAGQLLLALTLGIVPLALLGFGIAVRAGAIDLGEAWAPTVAAIGPGLLVALGVLAVAGVGAAVVGVRLWRADSPRLVPLLLGACLALAVLHNLVSYPLIEPSRDSRRLAHGLEEAGAYDGAGLVGLWVDETGEGAIRFYSGRTIENLYSFKIEEEVVPYLRANAGKALLVRAHFLSLLPEETRARLQGPRATWRYSSRSTYVLYRIAPATD